MWEVTLQSTFNKNKVNNIINYYKNKKYAQLIEQCLVRKFYILYFEKWLESHQSELVSIKEDQINLNEIVKKTKEPVLITNNFNVEDTIEIKYSLIEDKNWQKLKKLVDKNWR